MPTETEKEQEIIELSKSAKGALEEVDEIFDITKPPKDERTYLHRLRPWHDKVLLALLEGKTPSDIGREVGCHPTWVVKIWKSEVGRKRLAELGEKVDLGAVKERISNLASKAAEILEEILNSGDPNLIDLKARVAKDVLDRAGVKEAEKHNITYESIFRSIKDAIEETSNEIENK